jgi:hypothetical protein
MIPIQLQFRNGDRSGSSHWRRCWRSHLDIPNFILLRLDLHRASLLLFATTQRRIHAHWRCLRASTLVRVHNNRFPSFRPLSLPLFLLLCLLLLLPRLQRQFDLLRCWWLSRFLCDFCLRPSQRFSDGQWNECSRSFRDWFDDRRRRRLR